MSEEEMDEETLAVEAACDGGNHAAKAVQSYIDKLKAEIALLKDAIRRLAEQDATLSVCDGAVTVTLDNALTPVDRLAIEWAAALARKDSQVAIHKTLRRLLEKLG